MAIPDAGRMGAARRNVARLAARETDWPGKFQPIPWVYCEIVRRLARVERVHILVNDEARSGRPQGAASAHADCSRGLSLHPDGSELDARFLPDIRPDERGRPVITDWQFNGWAKYDNWQLTIRCLRRSRRSCG